MIGKRSTKIHVLEIPVNAEIVMRKSEKTSVELIEMEKRKQSASSCALI